MSEPAPTIELTKEGKLLQQIFGEGKFLWKGRYEVDWCDHCEQIIIKCPDCIATSCNCTSCEKCHDDITEFHKCKYHPQQYMTEEECEVLDKYRYLKRFITECIEAGKTEIDWEWIYREGRASQRAMDLFPELQKLDEDLKLWEEYKTARLQAIAADNKSNGTDVPQTFLTT